MDAKKREINVKKLCILGLLTALTCVATMIIRIPIPATEGYINLGDSIILISAVLFGNPYGVVAGAVGSALADLLSGYASYAPITFLVKGFEGLVVAGLAGRASGFFTVRKTVAAIIGVAWMVLGYFLAECVMYGVAAAASSALSNCVQAAGGFVVYAVLGYALYKAGIQKYVHNLV